MTSRHAVTAAAILIAIASLRIATTYRVFSATADEATHVGAGLELYQYHRYQLQRLNPPAARAVLGLSALLGGMRYNPNGNLGDQLHSVYYGAGRYERNLFFSRVGNLLFLIVAAAAVFSYVRQRAGDTAAIVAVFLLTFEPAILGHRGLATNDAAATAGLAVSLLAFARWLERPSVARAAILGLAWTFAILCKFSNIAFVPLACLAVAIVRLVIDRERRMTIVRRAPALLVIPLLTPFAIWASYMFTVGEMNDLDFVRWGFGARFEQFIAAHPSAPLPAPDFFFGLAHIRLIDIVGHLSYFCGEVSKSGWPLYFPTTLLLKTTLAALLFIAAGFWFTRRDAALRALFYESVAVTAVLLLFSSTSRLDLGIRYILPVLVPLAIAAAAGATAVLRSHRPARIIAALLLGWHGVTSLVAHPDYFPYFNFLAGRDPSRYLIDSNLDWGQDILRLRRELRRVHADRVGVSLMAGADYDALGFPPHYQLDANHPEAGWVAVSDHMYRMDGALFGGWRC